MKASSLEMNLKRNFKDSEEKYSPEENSTNPIKIKLEKKLSQKVEEKINSPEFLSPDKLLLSSVKHNIISFPSVVISNDEKSNCNQMQSSNQIEQGKNNEMSNNRKG